MRQNLRSGKHSPYIPLCVRFGAIQRLKDQRQLGHVYQPPGTATEFDSWRDMRIAQENYLGKLQPSVLIIGTAIQQHKQFSKCS